MHATERNMKKDARKGMTNEPETNKAIPPWTPEPVLEWILDDLT